MLLRAPQIQTIIQREGDDAPDQPQEAYLFLAEWIHRVAVDSEHAQSTMRCRQRYADSGTEAYFLIPLFKSRITLFRVPIDSMLWLPAAHSLPHWPLLHRQVRKRDWTLAPNEVLDFCGVLLQHNEVKVIKVQELANFIRESPRQFFRFAASGDRFADAQHGLIPVAVTFRRSHRICSHDSYNAGTRRRPHVLIQPMLNDDSVALRVAKFCPV